MAFSCNREGKRGPDAHAASWDMNAGSRSPEPHLIQELHRSPQDLPPLVHLDAVELLLQGQDLRPLRGRLGELAVGDTGPEWELGLPRPPQAPSSLGLPTHPLARARLCQDSKVWAVLSRDQRR